MVKNGIWDTKSGTHLIDLKTKCRNICSQGDKNAESVALTRQMSGVRISQRPLLRNPRLLTGVFVFMDVQHICHTLSKYVIYNHNMDTLCMDTLPKSNSLTQRKQGGIPRLIGGVGMCIRLYICNNIFVASSFFIYMMNNDKS